jgi:hypothetical protein
VDSIGFHASVVRPESAVMRLLRLFGRGCFGPRGTEIADSTHSACRREESHGSHVNGSLLLSCLAPGIHDIIRSKDMQCNDVICTPRFPTISQPFPNHFSTGLMIVPQATMTLTFHPRRHGGTSRISWSTRPPRWRNKLRLPRVTWLGILRGNGDENDDWG